MRAQIPNHRVPRGPARARLSRQAPGGGGLCAAAQTARTAQRRRSARRRHGRRVQDASRAAVSAPGCAILPVSVQVYERPNDLQLYRICEE
jgi:hypothetical protein